MRRTLLLSACASIAVLLGGAGCGHEAEIGQEGSITAVQQEVGQIGDVLPGTDPVEFEEAADAFAEVELIEDGLGPTFNEAACGNCHTTPVMGGSGEQIERRFGRVTNGIFFGFDSDEENEGGTLRQLFSNGTYVSGTTTCTIPVDVEPSSANVNNVGRRTTPLFGLGLVDAMPDWWFDFLRSIEPSDVRGVVQRVPVALPDPRDPTQGIGTLRVGRFGHKGLVPSLTVFSGDAYDNEMGITTQSCFNGTSILEFAVENHPNNIPPPAGCNGGDLALAQPPGVPDVPEFVDDPVGPCTGGRTEIQDDIVLFAFFMEHLAPPPVRITDLGGFLRGAYAFGKAKCAGCHTPIPFVTPAQPFNGVPGNFVFQPFSDFLGHDMGALGDGIGASGDSVATTRIMRTAPLWGARFNTSFLHDGRATTIRDAILFHDGQAAGAREAFNRLTSREQNDLVTFLNSI